MLRDIKKGTNLQTISIHKSVPCRQDSLAWLPLTVNIFNYFLLISLLPLLVSSYKAAHNFASSSSPVPALLFPYWIPPSHNANTDKYTLSNISVPPNKHLLAFRIYLWFHQSLLPRDILLLPIASDYR